MNGIDENIRCVQARLTRAAAACGRNPEEITLVAVSKTFPCESISAAVAAGLRNFGENRVQEAESKIPHCPSMPCLTWHMIGHLQSNKAHRAVELFDVIQSVDSVKLAGKLSQACLAFGKNISVFVQADLGLEETKFGAERDEVADIVAAILELQGLHLDGLMTIPPYFEDPERTRPYFVALRELRRSLEQGHPGCLGRGQLSMGMSHDFEVAIQEGATLVRVGTAIFGERSRG
jgi:pyridoxal phosphate enzyme (YggS family)